MNSIAEPVSTNPPGPGARRSWFPWLWTVGVAVVCLGIQLGPSDRDVKNFFIPVCFLALVLGLTGWVLLRSQYPWRKKFVWGVLPWIVLLTLHSQIKLVNNGDVGITDWRWRWSPTPDQELSVPIVTGSVEASWEPNARDYSAFLGGGYWAEVNDVQLATDWQANPPRELWRCEVGAGWTGFSTRADYAFTQEQRGDQELVVCYRINTDNPKGEIVWSHSDSVRFDPGGAGGLGGVGPRATPTIFQDRVLTLGATGILNCLEMRSGKVLWSHDTLGESGIANIMWGKSSSPLILETEKQPTLVVVSVGAPGASLVAYDLETGNQVWAAGDRCSSYATPVIVELLGERQILSVNEDYLTAHRATDGNVLWEYEWPGNSDSDASVSQPIPLPPNRVFLSKGYGSGASLIELSKESDGNIMALPVWDPPIKKVMKTKMCNVVVRNEYVYGLDAGILQCIDLERGKSHWKKRRLPAIGHGQIMLIGDTIVILSETGELILVEATPDEYRELASMRVFPEEQVTWNNPAFASPYLLLRNAEQAVCLEMPLQ